MALNLFVQEIKSHIENDALAHHHREQWLEALQATSIYQYSWQYAAQAYQNPDLFYEAWASKGHPTHPCNKTKLGFTQEDTLRYSPEFEPEVGIIIAAIANDQLHITSSMTQNYREWFQSEYPEAYHEWQQALEKQHLNPENYQPLRCFYHRPRIFVH